MVDGKEDVHSPLEKKSETSKDEKVYPCSLASHEDVLKDPVGFMDTLKKFHSTLGTRFMIPVIGGKELDLHLLYVEVTRRGGLEKVVADRKWKEVIAVFKFPPTTTSASFVLRKYYITLLHHYEQVYFFKRGGPLVPPAAASLSVKSPSCRPANILASESVTTPTRQSQDQQQEEEIQISKRRRRSKTGLQIGAPLNSTVVGIIDGKFDHGYLVSVKLGSEVLHGVLYHPGRSEDNGGSASGIMAAGRLRRRRKGRRRDPNHPKPNRSAYNFFFAEKHSKLKLLYPQREREFSKMIGESWNKLTDEERMVYQACGLKDKERYKNEMQEYRERLKLLQPNEGMSERRQRRRLSAVSSCLVPDQAAVGTSAVSLPPDVATVGTVDEKE
ncbi:high mobility group B protein 9-like isoform X2 [Nymphaea colorata]|nr:high mobility group B protein 9-like isoform X2 [Nymphaea colorata]